MDEGGRNKQKEVAPTEKKHLMGRGTKERKGRKKGREFWQQQWIRKKTQPQQK